MDKNKIWELINDQLPQHQQSEIWKQINASPEYLRHYQELKKAWSLSAAETHFSEKEISKKLDTFKEQYMQKPTKFNWIGQTLKYAVVLLVAFIASYLLYTTNESVNKNQSIVQHFESGTGNVSSIKLSDGSQIWLNSNSTVDLISQDASKVELKLVGEALFNIIHNEQRQFIVNTKAFKVEDLGTRFNIRSYPNDTEAIATLIEGEIAVSNTAHQLNEILKPGQQIKYSVTNNQYSISTIDTTFIGKWKENKFEFVDKTLSEIAIDLENWYDVSIKFQNTNIADERFTGVIQKSTSISNVLDILAYTAGINYSINTKNNKTEIMIQ